MSERRVITCETCETELQDGKPLLCIATAPWGNAKRYLNYRDYGVSLPFAKPKYGEHHFCDFSCLASWAFDQAEIGAKA